MLVATNIEALKTVYFFRGLNEEELGKISDLCKKDLVAPGELCQKEGLPTSRINFIVKGKVGVEFHLPNIAFGNKDIILYTLNEGDVFGWSSLINVTPWSSLRALEPTEVLYIESEDLLSLCENDSHIGYVLMKNLALLISSRFRRTRMATLNTMVAIKGEW